MMGLQHITLFKGCREALLDTTTCCFLPLFGAPPSPPRLGNGLVYLALLPCPMLPKTQVTREALRSIAGGGGGAGGLWTETAWPPGLLRVHGRERGSESGAQTREGRGVGLIAKIPTRRCGMDVSAVLIGGLI